MDATYGGSAEAVSTLDEDPYADEVLTAPEPLFERLREAGPVVWLSRYGVYATGRHAEAEIVLTDHERFSTTGGVGLADARKPGVGARSLSELLEVDPPEHTGVRSVIQRLMSPTVMKQWRALFDHAADRLVLGLVGCEVEAMHDLAEAFVFEVFPQAMGIEFDPPAIRAIGSAMFNQSGPANTLSATALAEAAPYQDWFVAVCEREAVKPGSIADSLFAAEDDGRLKPGVARNMVRAYIRGGTDSTIAGLGALMGLLADHPEQWAMLRSEPALLRTALDEAIRLQSPFHVTFRVTARATELFGFALEADRKIGVFLGAAGQDPRRWDRPKAFDLRRKVAGHHLAFGTGAHNCIGQMIARMENDALIGAMMRHVSRIIPTGNRTWRTVNQMRMVDRLPVRLEG